MTVEMTNIGVVDIAIDDIAHDIAADCHAQVVRRCHDIGKFRGARAEQFDLPRVGVALASLRSEVLET